MARTEKPEKWYVYGHKKGESHRDSRGRAMMNSKLIGSVSAHSHAEAIRKGRARYTAHVVDGAGRKAESWMLYS